jgi:hypothetical protein
MQILRSCLTIVAFALCAFGQTQEAEHNHAEHAQHHADVMEHGETAMGFSQTATTHHFKLLPDGGYIQVQANSAEDAQNRDHVRTHLQRQAKNFAAGDFSRSEMTHGRVLPGTAEMAKLKSAITYKYEEIERGARLGISSSNQAAIDAIHQFLKFQIKDHETGDSTAVFTK